LSFYINRRRQGFTGGFPVSSTKDPDDASISANLAGWWKADSLSLTDGDPISTWSDSSGNGNDWTQSGSARPTYKASIYNSLATVRFDASDDQMTNSMGFTEDDHTLIAVYYRNNTSGDHALISKYEPDGNQRGVLFYGGRSGSSEAGYANSTNGSTPVSSVRSTAGAGGTTLVVMAWRKDGSNVQFTSDTGDQSTKSTNSTIHNSTATARLGATDNISASTQSAWFDGDMCELCYYDTALSQDDTQAVLDGLVSKWGV
jgi:hypothetical protein